jgi:acetyltransferase-like isoleucine patch superfamily enzyme
MVFSKITKVLVSEVKVIYAFWVFKLVDLLGYGSIGNRVRAFILKRAGFKIGSGCFIHPGVFIYSINTNLQIGKGAGIGRNVYFDALNSITIGDYVGIGHGTKFVTSSHELISNFQTLRPDNGMDPIVIEDYVWLACNVVVLGGVTVGRGSVVGAGSVVTKSIPPNCFAAGVPAKVIRSLEMQPTEIQ